MQDAFGVVIFVVMGVAVVVAVLSLAGRSKLYDQIGRGGLNDDREAAPRDSAPSSGAGVRERDEEVRQMLQAQNERRARRGQPALDVDEELRRLTRPSVDAGLRAEIRELVIARNERRERRGQPPLDVEAEVERQIADVSEL